jgi:hypothetical protein
VGCSFVKSHHAQRRDANEADIVDALIENGYEVLRCNGLPFDLIVGRNQWAILEVKTATGRLTESQERFFDNGTAPRFVVRTVEEALEIAQRYC